MGDSIKIRLNVTQFIPQALKMAEALRKIGVSITDVTKFAPKFDAAGKRIVGGSLKGLDKAGRAVTGTFAKVGTQFQVTGSSVAASAAEMAVATKERFENISTNAATTARKIAGSFTTTFGGLADEPAKLQRKFLGLEAQLTTLFDKAAVSTGKTTREISKLVKEGLKSPRGFKQLDERLRPIALKVLDIKSATDTVIASQAKLNAAEREGLTAEQAAEQAQKRQVNTQEKLLGLLSQKLAIQKAAVTAQASARFGQERLGAVGREGKGARIDAPQEKALFASQFKGQLSAAAQKEFNKISSAFGKFAGKSKAQAAELEQAFREIPDGLTARQRPAITEAEQLVARFRLFTESENDKMVKRGESTATNIIQQRRKIVSQSEAANKKFVNGQLADAERLARGRIAADKRANTEFVRDRNRVLKQVGAAEAARQKEAAALAATARTADFKRTGGLGKEDEVKVAQQIELAKTRITKEGAQSRKAANARALKDIQRQQIGGAQIEKQLIADRDAAEKKSVANFKRLANERKTANAQINALAKKDAQEQATLRRQSFRITQAQGKEIKSQAGLEKQVAAGAAGVLKALEDELAVMELLETAERDRLALIKRSAAARKIGQELVRGRATETRTGRVVSRQFAGAQAVISSTQAERAKFAVAASKFNKVVKNINIDSERMITLFREVQRRGDAAFNTADEEKYVGALKKIIVAQKQLGAEARKIAQDEARLAEARKARVSIREQLSGKGRQVALGLKVKGVDASQATALQKSLIDVERQVEKLGLSSKRVSKIFAQMRKGIVPDVKGSERQIVSSLRRVITAQNSLAGGSKNLASGLSLSLRNFARLGVINAYHRALATVVNTMREGVRIGIEFSQTVSLIRTLTQETIQSTLEWQSTLVEISSTLGLGLTDVAEGVYEAVSNQIVETTAQARLFANEVGRLAIIARSSFDDAGKLVAGLVNSYRTGLGDVQRINAQLFKATDLGKFKIAEIADQLGRAAPQAKLLGVRMEELLGSISVLTIEGRKANASITLIRNVMLKLLKPTEKLQEVLEEWGFTTGAAAVQTLGFTEVLARLRKESPEALSQIFQDLRAVEGILSLTANSFEKFDRFTKQIGGAKALEDFAKAFELVEEDPFRELIKEGQRLTNFFSIEVGQGIGKALAVINDGLGGTTSFLRDVVDTIRPITAIFTATFKVIGGIFKIFGGLGPVLRTALQLAVAFAQVWLTFKGIQIVQNLVVGMAKFGKRIVEANKSLAVTGEKMRILKFRAAAAGVALIAGVFFAMQKISEANEILATSGARALEKNVDANRKAADAFVVQENRKTQILRRQLNKRTALILDFFAKQAKIAGKQREETGKGAKAISKQIVAQLEVRAKAFEDLVRKTSDSIKSLDAQIARSFKTITKIHGDSLKIAFNTSLELAKISDDAFVQSLENQRKELDKQIKNFDKAIDSSKKRVKKITQEEEGSRFGAFQALQSARLQVEALIQQSIKFNQEARKAASGGAQEVASELLGRANDQAKEAQKLLRDQIKEQQDTAKKLREQKPEGDDARERIKNREILRKKAEEADLQGLVLLAKLNQLETQRRGIVDRRIAAETQFQADQLKAQNEAIAKREELEKRELAFQREAEVLTRGRISQLGEVASQLLEAGQTDRAINLIKEQEALAAQLQTQKLQAVSQAKQNDDAEAFNKALKEAEELDKQRLNINQTLIGIELDRIKILADQKTALDAAKDSQVLALRGIQQQIKEARLIKILDRDGTLKDLDDIRKEFGVVIRTIDDLVESARPGVEGFTDLTDQINKAASAFDKFGRQIDLEAGLAAGLEKLEDAFKRAESLERVPDNIRRIASQLGITGQTIQEVEIQSRSVIASFRTRFDKISGELPTAANAATEAARRFRAASRDLLGTFQVELGGFGQEQFQEVIDVFETLNLRAAFLRKQGKDLFTDPEFKEGQADLKREFALIGDLAKGLNFNDAEKVRKAQIEFNKALLETLEAKQQEVRLERGEQVLRGQITKINQLGFLIDAQKKRVEAQEELNDGIRAEIGLLQELKDTVIDAGRVAVGDAEAAAAAGGEGSTFITQKVEVILPNVDGSLTGAKRFTDNLDRYAESIGRR